jgi:hypothetical protein
MFLIIILGFNLPFASRDVEHARLQHLAIRHSACSLIALLKVIQN